MDTPDADLQEVVELAREVSRAVVDVVGAGGVNILNASGVDAEQPVLHLHFHVVPRWAGDGITTWPAGRSDREVAENALSRLRSALQE
jgi:histidine triad (HIT) family protein